MRRSKSSSLRLYAASQAKRNSNQISVALRPTRVSMSEHSGNLSKASRFHVLIHATGASMMPNSLSLLTHVFAENLLKLRNVIHAIERLSGRAIEDQPQDTKPLNNLRC